MVAFLLVLTFLVATMRLTGSGELTRSLDEMDKFSLNPYDFFIPNLLHPLFGDRASQWFPGQRAFWTERGVVLGYVSVALALIGLLRGRPRRLVLTLSGVWVLSYVIALGPTLHFADAQVRVWGAPVPLPSLLLYYFLPGARSMRVMARFGVWTGLMTAALAGSGLVHLTESTRRRWGAKAAAVCVGAAIAAVAFESMTSYTMLLITPRAIDHWLAQQPADTVIVEMPYRAALTPFQNYFATQHGRAEVFGWACSSFSPPELSRRIEALRDFPLAQSVAFLHSIGVTHVLLRPRYIDHWEFLAPLVEQAPGLRYDRTIGNTLVYQVLH